MAGLSLGLMLAIYAFQLSEERTSSRYLLTSSSVNGGSGCGASGAGASLAGASLAGASLAGASLTGASLAGASLVGASLTGASLDGASLVGASLDGVFSGWFTSLLRERMAFMKMSLTDVAISRRWSSGRRRMAALNRSASSFRNLYPLAISPASRVAAA